MVLAGRRDAAGSAGDSQKTSKRRPVEHADVAMNALIVGVSELAFVVEYVADLL